MLECRNLCIKDSDFYIIKDISFRVECSKPLCIVGPVNSGKSLLLKTIGGFRKKKSSGLVFFKEKSGILHDKILPISTYICGITGLYDELTVNQNLKFWSRFYGTESLLKATLDYFDMWEIKNIRLSKLNFALKMRVSLSRLMLTGKPLWLLDEPYSCIDKLTTDLLSGIIKAKCESGNGVVIYTSKDIGSARFEDSEIHYLPDHIDTLND